jgi:hypothetical protein
MPLSKRCLFLFCLLTTASCRSGHRGELKNDLGSELQTPPQNDVGYQKLLQAVQRYKQTQAYQSPQSESEKKIQQAVVQIDPVTPETFEELCRKKEGEEKGLALDGIAAPGPPPENYEDAKRIIRTHIEERFKELMDSIDAQLLLRQDVSVTIPYSDQFPYNHSLGVGRAVGQWEIYESSDPEFVPKLIQDQLKIMQQKYVSEVKVTFFGRDKTDPNLKPTSRFIGVRADLASPTNFQLWGANAYNWNIPDGMTPKDVGGAWGGQAAAIDKQKPGIFGIVTTPLEGLNGIDSKTNLDLARKALEKMQNVTSQQKDFLKTKLDEPGRITNNYRSVNLFLLQSQMYLNEPGSKFPDVIPTTLKQDEVYKRLFNTLPPKVSVQVAQDLNNLKNLNLESTHAVAPRRSMVESMSGPLIRMGSMALLIAGVVYFASEASENSEGSGSLELADNPFIEQVAEALSFCPH